MKAIVDCNSFYVACERLFQPWLRNKPVVVLSNNDGCIISRSDEAKALGIAMGIPYYQAKGLITANKVEVFSSNYHLYGDISFRVMETLRSICTKVEVYSVDEAFVDLPVMSESELFEYGSYIRDTVEMWTGIPVSVGIASTKTLAKLANRLAKKNKKKTSCVVVLCNDEKITQALKDTPVKDVWGVGRKNAEKLYNYGINDAYTLKQANELFASKSLGGVVGIRLLKELNGFPCVTMKNPLVKKQMINTSRMFGKPVYKLEDLKEAVASYISRAAEKLRRQKGAAKLVQVFFVANNAAKSGYTYAPKSMGKYTSLLSATDATPELIRVALALADSIYEEGSHYIKAGVMLGDIVPAGEVQSSFLQPYQKDQKKLMSVVDNINFGMRGELLKFGASGLKRDWKMRQEFRSPRYSTRWDEIKKIG